MAPQSMTGFGTLAGQKDGVSWVWEIRSVNGRGLDMRLRLPEGAETLEPYVRKSLPKYVTRGNVSVNLKLSGSADAGAQSVNPENLTAAITAIKDAGLAAAKAGIDLAPVSVGDILQQKWVWETAQTDNAAWVAEAKAQFSDAVAAFVSAREGEGQKIWEMLAGQLDTLKVQTQAAKAASDARNQKAGGIIREKVLSLLEITEIVDEDRLAQELATLAVKADVTEELDRLAAHITAAQDLLDQNGPVGRKFDFLMQEFNREANTLCSKSSDSALTAIGLELKVIIDQMREQVQNLE